MQSRLRALAEKPVSGLHCRCLEILFARVARTPDDLQSV